MGIGTGSGLTLVDELDELIDVVITAPVSGQVLQYDAANHQWINATGGGGSGSVTSVSAGGGLTASTNPITATGDISIANTAVSAGSYTYTSLTVNSRGQITTAANGTAPVTSVGVSGKNGITVAGSPITSTGTIDLGLGQITPTGVTTGVVSASTLNVTGDVQAAGGTVTASAATISSKLTGATAVFSGLVSADGGINTTVVSGASINVTGDVRATTGRVLASAATFTSLLTGAAATFSGIVSANSGLNATTGNFSGLLTGATATFSGLVSAGAGINTTAVSAASVSVTGDINAGAGRVTASAATITGLLTGATATFSGLVSANAGLASTTGSFSGLLTGATATFSGMVSANAGIRTTTVSASGVINGSNITGTNVNTGDQTITLTGDVSGTGTGSFAATINPATVTNAKLANMAAFTIKSNIQSSAAVPTDNTLSTIIDTAVSGAAHGDILFRGNGAWTKLVAGTSGQYLMTQGVSADPKWGTVAGTGTVTSVSAGGGLTASSNPITASGDISIATGGVTYAKIQTVASQRLLGNPYNAVSAATEISLGPNLTFSGTALNTITTVTSIAFNGTTATDASLGSYFRGTAVSAFTLSNPTNASDGQKIIWEIIQDGTGGRTIALGNKFAFGTDISAGTVVLSTTSSKRDFLGAFYNSTADKFYITSYVKGY